MTEEILDKPSKRLRHTEIHRYVDGPPKRNKYDSTLRRQFDSTTVWNVG